MKHFAIHKLSKIQYLSLPKVSDGLCCGNIDSIFFHYYSYYAYDHTGERTLKLTGKNSFVDVNGETQATATLENATLYVGPYLVATNQGYTKHYYNGTERICAKLGNGGLGNDLLSNPSHSAVANGLFTQCQTAMKEQSAKEEDQMCISSVSGEWNPEMRLEGYKDKFSPVQPNLQPQTSINVSTFRNALSSYISAASASENNIYFYHGDHLGSASWITNGNGTPVQHLQYMPYGEPFINERISSSSYEERYTFTGKERDSETGYSYFGARFYDSDLMTGWLSVDPMADKYPNISPYAYCANNPVKLVDPDGNAVILTNTLKSNSSISFILSVASKNSVFRNVMQNFYSDKSNVYIHLGQLMKNGIPSGSGNLARAERAASPNNPVGKYGIGRIVINSDILDKSGNFSGDQTFIFAALLHEGIHAKMHDIYRTDPTFSNYPGYKDFILNRSQDGAHHNQMAAFNRQTLIDGMKEFDNQIGASHSDEWYEAISWTGLQNTKAWKDFYKMNPELGERYKKIQRQERDKLGGE